MKEIVVELLPSSLSGEVRERLLYVVALGLLVVGTVLCLLALRMRVLDVLAAGVACAGAVAWLMSNQVGEGRTLLVVQPGNGLTSADLAVVPAGVLVGYLVVRRLRAT